MARVAPAIPEESALLCEKCGYIVDGLPMDSLCPECATPIEESLPENRGPTSWEGEGSPGRRFVMANLQLIFKPTRFFRLMKSRADLEISARFARVNLLITSIFFGATAYLHGIWAWPILGRAVLMQKILIVVAFSATAFWLLELTANVAGRLTAWEAAYRGLRLPHRVVQRALHYHTAHYLPVALLAFATVLGHQVLIHKVPSLDLYYKPYLYLLCGEVILAAGYLFSTYWTGMRNLMYANG